MKKKKNKHPQYIQMYMKYDILCIENIITACSLKQSTLSCKCIGHYKMF
jgi:hypothetical protein